MKRGQVSIFIILAVVIVVGVGSFLFISSYEKNNDSYQNTFLSEATQHYYSLIHDCITQQSYEGILEVGKNAGYYTLPRRQTAIGVPYYFYEGELMVPSLSDI